MPTGLVSISTAGVQDQPSPARCRDTGPDQALCELGDVGLVVDTGNAGTASGGKGLTERVISELRDQMPTEWTGKALEACLGSGIHSRKEQMVCGFFEDPDRSLAPVGSREKRTVSSMVSSHVRQALTLRLPVCSY